MKQDTPTTLVASLPDLDALTQSSSVHSPVKAHVTAATQPRQSGWAEQIVQRKCCPKSCLQMRNCTQSMSRERSPRLLLSFLASESRRCSILHDSDEDILLGSRFHSSSHGSSNCQIHIDTRLYDGTSTSVAACNMQSRNAQHSTSSVRLSIHRQNLI